MRVCDVSITTSYGETHALTLTASSLFDAAHRGCNEWARFWWWDAESVITVRAGEQVWQVRAQRVIDWEFKRRKAERQSG